MAAVVASRMHYATVAISPREGARCMSKGFDIDCGLNYQVSTPNTSLFKCLPVKPASLTTAAVGASPAAWRSRHSPGGFDARRSNI